MHEIDIYIIRGLRASRSAYGQWARQIGRNIVNHPIVDRNRPT